MFGKLLHQVLDCVPGYKSKPLHRFWVYINWENCEVELKWLDRVLPEGRRRVAVDVGANHGYYSVALSRLCGRVHAFEVNPQLAEELRVCPIRNLTVCNEGLSDRTDDAILYIPTRADGYQLLGWASLTPGNCPGITRHTEVPVRIAPLDSRGLDEVDFIKIDVEGHELAVLRGASKTIEKNRPVILVEVKPENEADVQTFFSDRDYVEVNIGELVGRSLPASENRIFMPR